MTDEIERLREELKTERVLSFRNEVARLEEQLFNAEQQIYRVEKERNEQLAASRAREAKLREAIDDYFTQYPHMMKGYILDALNLPTDDTALREYRKTMLLEAAEHCNKRGYGLMGHEISMMAEEE